MEQTLLLNATYEPLKIVHWQKAVTLWVQGKVEVISVYDREVRAVSFSFRLPSVIRLLRRVKIRRKFDYVPFSRANIYARDHYACQYCGHVFPTGDLTFDHVVPVAHGGRKDWENIVTCCITCNRRKGGRTPEQAGMRLVRLPRRPDKAPALRITIGVRDAPESWRDYLYWNIELDDGRLSRSSGSGVPTPALFAREPFSSRSMTGLFAAPRRAGRARAPRRHRPRDRARRHAGGPHRRRRGARGVRLAARGRRFVVPSDTRGRPLAACGSTRRPASTVFLEVGRTLATGLHMVDSPVDRRRRRGLRHLQRLARPAVDASRSIACGPTASARCSSPASPTPRRWPSIPRAGSTSRAASTARCRASTRTGEAEVIASDLGVATGLAFDRRGRALRRRSVRHDLPSRAQARPCRLRVAAAERRRLPPRRRARTAGLYATAPTLSTRDAVYRIDRHGAVTTIYEGFGRPQGLAVDADGALYVTEALAGASGIYRLRPGQGPPRARHRRHRPDRRRPAPRGGFVVSTSETVYRFDSQAA